MSDSPKTDTEKAADEAAKKKAPAAKKAKTVHYVMPKAGSTVPKGAETRVSYAAGQIVEAEAGAFDHVGGAKSYATAEKAADAGK